MIRDSLFTMALLAFLLTPAAAVEVGITAEGPQAGFGDVLVLGPGARVAVQMEDDADTTRFEPVLDGAPVSLDAWSTGWDPGPHRMSGVVVTEDGTRSPATPLDVVFDPTPPVVDREIGDLALLKAHGLDQGVEPKKPRRVERHRDVAVYWSADGRRWLPLLPPGEERFQWVVEGDKPQVFFYVERNGGLHLNDGTPVQKGQVVRLWAFDELSATSVLGMSTTIEGLEIVVRDLVGNETRQSWPLGN